ncbi:unnamed protein product [Didymodactylos carnosus]|uniref:LIM zinc-binding domain-containing protein n=1 Tax=Didymodactylos carnosus TaxID=1234261 RepID=A0A814KW46_9BILA|nr:unnamed protein product [Didymodactylos carnosus]CAF3825115.1 unnamed protein product [Didymodactylos carnosus]
MARRLNVDFLQVVSASTISGVCCDCRLSEVGSTLFVKESLILCKRDYLRLFQIPGSCAQCKKSISAFDMVMRVKHLVYHLNCFACYDCRQRFCIGDRFFLIDNQILCESDYHERAQQISCNHNNNN